MTVETQKSAAELKVAPGSVVRVRDEEWLVTQTAATSSGTLIRVQGLTELVRDTEAGGDAGTGDRIMAASTVSA